MVDFLSAGPYCIAFGGGVKEKLHMFLGRPFFFFLIYIYEGLCTLVLFLQVVYHDKKNK